MEANSETSPTTPARSSRDSMICYRCNAWPCECIMIEIEEKYCKIAAQRLRQEVLFP